MTGYNHDNHSLYIVGHTHQQAIAEFAVPALVNSTNLVDLNMAGAPLQSFITVLDWVSGSNPQLINCTAAMELVSGLSLGGHSSKSDSYHFLLAMADAYDLRRAIDNIYRSNDRIMKEIPQPRIQRKAFAWRLASGKKESFGTIRISIPTEKYGTNSVRIWCEDTCDRSQKNALGQTASLRRRRPSKG